MPVIKYETPDGTDVIKRDEYHTQKDGFVVAYDNESEGPDHKATIPTDRVVIING